MKRFAEFIVLVFFLPALVVSAQVATEYAGEGEVDYKQVAEDIEVMAKIIDKTLEKSFPDEYKSYGGLLSPFRAPGGERGCQGFYLNNYGAIFMTNISLPLAELEVSEEEPTPDDLWTQTKYELKGVKGGGKGFSIFGKGEGTEYDPEKVEQLKEELLKLIGTYAANIRHLGAQENIVIAVRGPGRIHKIIVPEVSLSMSDSGVHTTVAKVKSTGGKAPALGVYDDSTGDKALALGVYDNSTGDKALALKDKKLASEDEKLEEVNIVSIPSAPVPVPQVRTVVKVNGDSKKTDHLFIGMPDDGSGTRTTLIIKVDKKSIMEYKAGELSLESFAERADITQY